MIGGLGIQKRAIGRPLERVWACSGAWGMHCDRPLHLGYHRGELEDQHVTGQPNPGSDAGDEFHARRRQDLKSTVRAKAHQQRTMGTYTLELSPGFSIAVAMYATIQPATKGAVRGQVAFWNEMCGGGPCAMPTEPSWGPSPALRGIRSHRDPATNPACRRNGCTE